MSLEREACEAVPELPLEDCWLSFRSCCRVGRLGGPHRVGVGAWVRLFGVVFPLLRPGEGPLH